MTIRDLIADSRETNSIVHVDAGDVPEGVRDDLIAECDDYHEGVRHLASEPAYDDYWGDGWRVQVHH